MVILGILVSLERINSSMITTLQHSSSYLEITILTLALSKPEAVGIHTPNCCWCELILDLLEHLPKVKPAKLLGTFSLLCIFRMIILMASQVVPAGCSNAPVNYLGNEHISVLNRQTAVANEQITILNRPTKRNREAEDISRQQQLQISLNNNFYQDEVHRPVYTANPNPVSTGLRLSYDDDEHNSSVTSASGSMTAALPVILSLNDNLKLEIERQQEELDRYMRVQEEIIVKGVRDLKQRQMASFLNVLENGVCKKLQEKEAEIENINRKNRELVEKIKQVTAEAQSWQHRAKYTESVANALRNNLKQAIAQGANQPKEGCGDSEAEDAASSYIDHNSRPILGGNERSGSGRGLACRVCKVKEVSILFLPCRHLCLCKDCEGSSNVCPICQTVKTACVQVYMS